jgi:hypothetical protein
LPGTKAANAALDYANPWIGQLRQLISKGELRGLVSDLRPTVPDLANLSNASLPFLEQSRLLSSCFDNVVIPWSNTKIPNADSDPEAGKVYEETAYGLTGVAGESRTGDANGQEFRVLFGGGERTVSPFSSPEVNDQLTGVVPFEILGAEPAKTSSAKTPFRPDVPCETQDPPDLNSELGAPPTTMATKTSATTPPADEKPLLQRYGDILTKFDQAGKLRKSGQTAEAKQLMDQAGALYAAWLKDWTAFQRASGLHVSVPSAPKGAKH